MHYDATADLTYELEIPVQQTVPFSCTRLKLRVFARLPAREQTVTVQCPWTANLLTVPLGFTAPLMAVHKLHTSKQRKFIQVIVSGQSARRLQLAEVKLHSQDGSVKFKNLNPIRDDRSN